MKTAKQLKEKYEQDLKELQENCKHEDVSEWIKFMYAPGHYDIWNVKKCNICWKILQRMTQCGECGKDIILDEDKYKSLNYLDREERALKEGFCNKKCHKKWASGIIVE